MNRNELNTNSVAQAMARNLFSRAKAFGFLLSLYM